jgi:hypothetical protein
MTVSFPPVTGAAFFRVHCIALRRAAIIVPCGFDRVEMSLEIIENGPRLYIEPVVQVG